LPLASCLLPIFTRKLILHDYLAETHSGMIIEPLSPIDAIASTQLPDDFHKDPADRILVAIARRYEIPLVTCDAKILNYPHVKTIW
jgi:PIN domain nuclease of toxin-antitoxin system